MIPDFAALALPLVASEGNDELARVLLKRRNLDDAEYVQQRIAIEQAARPRSGVLVPIVFPEPLREATGVAGMLVGVRIADGEAEAPWDDDEAREAAREAVRAAWRDVGGPGEPPRVTATLSTRGALPVTGSSAYLGVYLAAVARFGDAPLRRNVLATGAFHARLDRWKEKLALAERAAERLAVRELLYAGSGPDVRGELLTRVPDRAHARWRTFHFDPWHREAEVRRVHVHCGAKYAEPPARFGKNVRTVELPYPLGPHHLDEAKQRVREALEGAERVELSIGGPAILAAALGVDLRNGLPTARIVDAKTGKPMWDNRSQSRPQPDPPRAHEPRVVVGPANLHVPEGWEHYVIDDQVTPDRMEPIVRDFLRKYGAVRRLHIAFATALPVAWAVAGMLKNHVSARFYHYESGNYVRWFDDPPWGESAYPPRGDGTNVFLNVSNHPSEAWSDAQRRGAEELVGGVVRDLPGGFPSVPPDADADEVLEIARDLAERILEQAPAAVFLAGEFGVTLAATAILLRRGVRVVTATTRRQAVEVHAGDATVRRSEFRFVRWRDLRLA